MESLTNSFKTIEADVIESTREEGLVMLAGLVYGAAAPYIARANHDELLTLGIAAVGATVGAGLAEVVYSFIRDYRTASK